MNIDFSRFLILFSIIVQVSIEMRALRLVEDFVISCYNHPARDDYNTEELIFNENGRSAIS